MSTFRAYTHLERIDRDECDGILQNHIVVQPKLDGSCSLVYARDGEVYCGSRTRELSDTKDNANFRNYILTSEDAEIAALREYVLAHPNYIVYGEWLGKVAPYTTKFVGSIKRYLEGGFFIFDVFDVDAATYLPYHEWEPEISTFYSRVVPLIAEFDNPTNGQIAYCIDKNDYNLPDGVLGEGIVIKAEPSFRDRWGNIQIAKIVRDEYKQDKAKPKKVYADGDVEQEIVEPFIKTTVVFVPFRIFEQAKAFCRIPHRIHHFEDAVDPFDGVSFFDIIRSLEMVDEFAQSHLFLVKLGPVDALKKGQSHFVFLHLKFNSL